MGQPWHPPRRLRHLEAVSARNLLLPRGAPAPATYFSLCVPAGAGGDCAAVYRSEAVGGTINPEWMPLSWLPFLDVTGEAGVVVLALHQVPGGSEHAAQLNTVVLFPEGTPGCTLQSQEAACECREAPCQQAAVAKPGAPAQRVEAEVAADGSSTDNAVRGPEGPQQAAAEATAIEPAAAPTGGGKELAQPGPPEQPGASPPSSEPAVPPAAAVEPGQAASAAGAAAPGCAEAQGSTCSSAAEQPGSMRPTEPCTQQEQQQLEQQRPAGGCAGAGPCALGHAGRPAAPAAGAAAARFPPAAFPGQLLAAWVVDLDRLHPVGEDLGALRDFLPGPNSLVLQVEGSLFLHPPPEAPEPYQSAQSSPTKRALSAADRLAPSSPAGSAPRRFANLLMSKLLRSTPNLQDGAESSRGVESDSESEAASEASGFSRLTTHTTVARESAAVGLLPSAAGGFAKAVSLSDLCLHITALVGLRTSVLELHSRALELRGQLERLVDQRLAAHEQEQQVRQAQQDVLRGRQRAQYAQQRLSQLQQQVAASRKSATVRAQALVTTLKVMQAADRKLRDAQESLQGDQGRERLVGLHRELVARRCLMVVQLGRIFRLGPITVKVPEAPPGGYLEDRLERQWVGSGTAGGGQGLLGSPLGVGADLLPPSNSSSTLDTPRQYRQEVHLSLGGIELRPAVWRAAFDDSSGADITAADDEAAAVALGYAAQLVCRLSDYLGVPLRYPLCLLGSKSSILDGQPPAGTWSAEEPTKRTLFGGRADAGGDAAAAAAGRPVEYPLYCTSRRERPQFAIGVFLLNKNVVQLLQVHGISAGGPNQLLHNLYKLLLAAQTALPGG